ncbi:MAG: hypothetical protein KJ043_11295 [Anaerolineae bacterium]|nr:hypothetical protein [Anaerolineae bacterium]
MKKRMVLIGFLLGLLLMPMLLSAQITIPTATPDPEMTAEMTPESTPEVVTVVIEASEGQEIDPPITIELPEGWVSRNSAVAVQDVMGLRVLPFTLYAGRVEGGVAFIILLWGFDNLVAPPPLTEDTVMLSPFMDGMRLLRLALLEPECNVGSDVEREYPIGDRLGLGTSFAAVDCPNTVDTRGWFVSLNVDSINFAFYVYTEPIEAMDGAEEDLQAILDSVRFDVPGFIERARAEQTPEPDITAEATPAP